MEVTARTNATPDAAIRQGARRWLIREIVGTLFVAGLLFFSAGRWNWGLGWSMVALYALWVTANALLIMPRHPALLAERAQRRLSDRRWDQIILSLYGLMTLVKYVSAGLDLRYGWSPSLPLALAIGAWIVAALGYALVTWSMVANAYFATVSRIQNERGQQVITDGPYRAVRHPGYIGSVLFELATPLALLSLWALIPGVISAVLMIVRTSFEDRMLQQELAGYQAYSDQTRYRLIPGLW